MYKLNSTQERILETINRIGARVISTYTADQSSEAIAALTEAYINQFDFETYNPRIEVARRGRSKIEVRINLPKIGKFKVTLSIYSEVNNGP